MGRIARAENPADGQHCFTLKTPTDFCNTCVRACFMIASISFRLDESDRWLSALLGVSLVRSAGRMSLTFLRKSNAYTPERARQHRSCLWRTTHSFTVLMFEFVGMYQHRLSAELRLDLGVCRTVG